MKTSQIVAMTMEEYRAHPAISKSGLDLVHRSPAHYWEEKQNPSPPTDAMLEGSLFHSFILEPDTFFEKYAVLPEKIDKRTKEGKETWTNWVIDHPTQMPVEKPTLDKLSAMREVLLNHSRIANILSKGGLVEHCLFWTDPVTGVECKGRPDLIIPEAKVIIDLKTTVDARIEPFSRSIWNYRYHVQAPFYMDGYKEVFGEYPEAFLYIPIEKGKPYCCACYHANEEMVAQGRREYRLDLEQYAECLRTDNWPGYPDTIQSVMLPRWAQEDV
jgi:hypothetical protein